MDKEFKKYRKSDAFKVPENYFEDFALKMQNELGDEAVAAPSIWDRLVYALQLRLTLPISLAFLLAYFVVHNQSDEQAIFKDAEIHTYLIEESDFWQEDELLDLAYGEKQSLILSDEELIFYLEEESLEEDLYPLIEE